MSFARIGRGSWFLLTASCALALVPAAATAAEVDVTTTADEFGAGAGCSLREAVEAANTDGAFGGCQTTTVGGTPIDTDLDIIYLPDPAYVLTLDGVEDANAAGDLDVRFEGLSILGQSPPGPSTIDGGSSDPDAIDDRVIEIHASAANGPVDDLGLTGLVIRGGSTADRGGGLFVNGPPAATEDFQVGIGLTTFTGNAAGSGGAINIKESAGIAEDDLQTDVVIHDSTISGNSTLGSGGGVLVIGPGLASARMENVTISNNAADSNEAGGGNGGGIEVQVSTTTLHNTIVAGNRDESPAGTVAPDCSEGGGALDSVNHNLIGSTAGPCGIDVGTGDIQNMPAGLEPLALNPGAGLSTVLTHALEPGSLARDAGNPAAPGGPVGTCAVLAQNFGPRPIGEACDIGAFEAPLPGGAGAALRCGGRAATITGTAGANTLRGTAGPDVIAGAGGRDVIRGRGGRDRICGGGGPDTLLGGRGKDRLFGQAGRDRLRGGPGRDVLRGGPGRDDVRQ